MTAITVDKKAIAKANAEARAAEELVEAAQALTIASNDDYKEVGEILVEIKARAVDLERRRKLITKPLMAAKKEVDALFKNPMTKLKEVETMLKRAISDYLQHLEEEKRRKLAEAAELSTTGGSAVEVREMLVAAETPAPKVEGISVRQVMKFEIEDEDALPRHLMTPNEKRIRNAIQSGAVVPGVRVWFESSVAAGRGE